MPSYFGIKRRMSCAVKLLCISCPTLYAKGKGTIKKKKCLLFLFPNDTCENVNHSTAGQDYRVTVHLFEFYPLLRPI